MSTVLLINRACNARYSYCTPTICSSVTRHKGLDEPKSGWLSHVTKVIDENLRETNKLSKNALNFKKLYNIHKLFRFHLGQRKHGKFDRCRQRVFDLPRALPQPSTTSSCSTPEIAFVSSTLAASLNRLCFARCCEVAVLAHRQEFYRCLADETGAATNFWVSHRSLVPLTKTEPGTPGHASQVLTNCS